MLLLVVLRLGRQRMNEFIRKGSIVVYDRDISCWTNDGRLDFKLVRGSPILIVSVPTSLGPNDRNGRFYALMPHGVIRGCCLLKDCIFEFVG